MDNFLISHIKDLSQRSADKNIYTYSNFLNEEEQNEVIRNRKLLTHFTFFGGAEGTVRNMVRFGNEEELYYSEDFPVDCIKIEPKNKKFADELSHRDFLGAIMNLSIEREHIGDIVIKDNSAFVFVTKKMSSFICENLTRIKHTDIKCSFAQFDNSTQLFTTQERTIISSSPRADCVICAVYNLSRSTADALFASKKVFLNSAQCESPSKTLRENDTVSIRGYGKFIFGKELSETKKGRIKYSVNIYV